MNEFSRALEYKISKQKSAVFLYTSNKQSKSEIKNTIPSITASQRIKVFGKNLTKEMEDSYTEKYETWLKEIKDLNK